MIENSRKRTEIDEVPVPGSDNTATGRYFFHVQKLHTTHINIVCNEHQIKQNS